MILKLLSVVVVAAIAMSGSGVYAQDDPDAGGTYGFSAEVETTTVGNGFSPFAGTKMYMSTTDGTVFSRVGLSRGNPRGSTWIRVPAAPPLTYVKLGGPYGAAWGVSSTQRGTGGYTAFYENYFTGSWIGTSFGVRSLDIGGPSGQVWGVNNSNQAFYRPFANPTSPGLAWTAVVSFPVILFSQISIGGGTGAGDVFGLGILTNFAGDKNVYYRTGVSNLNPSGSGWSQLSGQRLNRISVGGGFGGSSLPVVWGVTTSGTVYSRTGITNNNRRGSGWATISVSPRFRNLSVNGLGDTVYGLSDERVNGGYRIYYQTIGGFGVGWQPLDQPGTLFQGASSISAF